MTTLTVNTQEPLNVMSIITLIIDDSNEQPEEIGNYTVRHPTCLSLLPDDGIDITLDDCLRIAKEHVPGHGTITVINSTPLYGEVFMYGNHGPQWEQIGKTDGYA